MTCASPTPTDRPRRDHSFSTGSEPLLTADQERRLANAVARGDAAARDRLVRANLRLVVSLARPYAGGALEFEDLVGEGNLGLIKAAQRFDPGFDVRFSTYARHWIQEAIRSALTNRSRAIRLPSHMVTLLRKWQRAEAELAREEDRAPAFDHVADRLGLREAQRAMVRRALKSHVGADGPDEALSRLVDGLVSAAADPGAELERAESLSGLRERMAARLNIRERQLLELRYGLDGRQPLTLKQVAARLDMTNEGARKLEARAVAKLGDRHAG